jgi:guanine deaminase
MEEAAKLLFAIMICGDDRSVEETWVMGEQAYKKQEARELAAAGHR